METPNCFICFSAISGSKLQNPELTSKFRNALFQLFRLMSIPEGNPGDWDTPQGQTRMCCGTCMKHLDEITRLDNLIKRTKKLLDTQLRKVEKLIVTSEINAAYVSSISWSAPCHAIRKHVLQNVVGSNVSVEDLKTTSATVKQEPENEGYIDSGSLDDDHFPLPFDEDDGGDYSEKYMDAEPVKSGMSTEHALDAQVEIADNCRRSTRLRECRVELEKIKIENVMESCEDDGRETNSSKSKSRLSRSRKITVLGGSPSRKQLRSSPRTPKPIIASLDIISENEEDPEDEDSRSDFAPDTDPLAESDFEQEPIEESEASDFETEMRQKKGPASKKRKICQKKRSTRVKTKSQAILLENKGSKAIKDEIDTENEKNEESKSDVEEATRSSRRRKRRGGIPTNRYAKDVYVPYVSCGHISRFGYRYPGGLFLFRWGTFVSYHYTHLKCHAHECTFEVPFEPYTAFQEMRQHIMTRHRNNKHRQQTKHPCLLCDETLPNQLTFREHINLQHGDIYSGSYINSATKKEVKKYYGICEVCFAPHRSSFVFVHMFSHKNAEEKEAAIAAREVSKRSLRKKESEITERNYVCDIEGCGKAFKTCSNMKRHKLTHLAKEERSDMLTCEECGALVVKDRFKHHLAKFHHPEKADFKTCPICHKKFYFRDTIGFKHHLFRHKGEKTHLCVHCGASFFSAGALNGHIKSRHTELEIKCEYCDKVYTKKFSYSKHIQSRHPEHYRSTVRMSKFYENENKVEGVVYGPVQMFPCPMCEVLCKYKFTLRTHMIRYHSNNGDAKKSRRRLRKGEESSLHRVGDVGDHHNWTDANANAGPSSRMNTNGSMTLPLPPHFLHPYNQDPAN